ncbi:MAG: YkgJ family cysteine cluster protein [Pseudomonadota bacterium]|nr:MAG: zinc/iron-chelating domain-containing protein [Pseudomonadota bacterium]
MGERASVRGNSCLRCGACCATYRVSFYWAEAEHYGLPDSLIEKVSPWHACMAGTGQPEPRCRALAGTIGRSVSCLVYSRRPSPCRELQPGEDKCIRARVRHGLEPYLDEETPDAAQAPAA